MIDIINRFNELGFKIDEKKADQLDSYRRGILEYNEHINLTSITDEKEFIDKHYIDSLIGTDCDEFINAKTVIDVGTGAGFPGVPMAIMNPDKDFVLMDSLNKRLKIIEELCNRCGISNVRTLHMRAEDAGRNKSYRESFDLCVSRAVASLPVLCELCIPLVRKGGHFLAFKGPGAFEEIKEADKAIKVTGGKLIRTDNFEREELEFKHNIIIIEKFADTPSVYPRKAGTPVKKPIK